jgi:hypothetical protein
MTSALPRAPLFTRADFDLRGRGAIDADLRKRLEDWAERVVERLGDLGLALESTVVDGRAGPPGVVFVRNRREREQALRAARAHKLDYRPLFAGVFAENAKLVLRLTHATVEARLEIPSSALVDIHNLRAKIKEPEGLLAATSVVEGLPEQFWCGIDDGSQGPVSRVTGNELRQWVDEVALGGKCLFFGWTLPKDLAVSRKGELGAELEDAFAVLGSLYDVLAWSEVNDFFGPKRRLRQEGPVSRDGARSVKPQVLAKRAKPSRDARKTRRVRDAEELEDAEALALAEEAPSSNGERDDGRNGSRDGNLFPKKRPILRGNRRRAAPTEDVDPKLPIEKGTRICVLYGPFSGKVGIVQELDGKGGARVLFGLLAARLNVSDLVGCAEKKERQKLMSSHRKPLGARS